MRAIDADALREKATNAKKYDPEMMVVGLGYVYSAPTIDPVKHGRWRVEKVGRGSDLRIYTCPFCDFSLPLNPTKIPAYCEDCGAKLVNE